MSTTETKPTMKRTPVKTKPTVWGLSPVDVHDRFWASRGVQVVRQGESSAIVQGADLFLLTEARTLVIFKLGELLETLSWLKPALLLVRLRDQQDSGYREVVVADDEQRFLRFERIYGRSGSRLLRVALTADPNLARVWQNAPDTRAAWRLLRRRVRREDRTAAEIEGRVFERSDDRDLMACVSGLVEAWSRPDATVRRTQRVSRQVWTDREAEVGRETDFIGPVWVGAGRAVKGGQCVVGPAVLWDDPDARPGLEDVQWQEIEPTTAEVLARARPASVRAVPGKRLFDIVFSLLALALSLPLYPFIILAVLIESGWPPFFSHRRETLGGDEFPCLKFRSMRRDAEQIKDQLVRENMADGPQFFIEDDPRLTRVGRILRATQLDEIPQFLNVLLGHMSIVGPRPSPRSENQYCPAWREARLSVRPGITGLWQVKRTRRAGLDFQEWIRFDLEYVERASWRLDLWIIWRTLLYMVKVGAR